MTFHIAVSDDNSDDVASIVSSLHKYAQDCSLSFQIDPFTSASALLSSCQTPGRYHIIFLDVEMPDGDGISTAAKIRDLPDFDVKFIFISNYPKYMQKSFDVQAYHFLEKPLNEDSLFSVLDQAVREYRFRARNRFLIKSDQSEFLVDPMQLYYVEAEQNKNRNLIFHLRAETISCKGILKDYEPPLYSHGFLYVYRGILVNPYFIHLIRKTDVQLTNGIRLPLSRRYERSLKQHYIQYITKTMQKVQEEDK